MLIFKFILSLFILSQFYCYSYIAYVASKYTALSPKYNANNNYENKF